MPSTLHANDLSPEDKAGFSLFGSALLHVVVIMGVGFTYSIGVSSQRAAQSIATTLATASTTEEVTDVETFAEVSQSGGGLSEETAPVRSPLPLVNDPRTQAERLATEPSDPTDRGIDDAFVYVELPDALRVALARDPSEPAPAVGEQSQEGAEAMVRAPLPAEFDPEFSLGTRTPRQKFISSRTRENKYATYMEAWRSRVEQVGNTNYPEEARARRLSGSLVLDVAINANGSVRDIEVIRSSGQKVLDDSAVRIVMMAAPFEAFPEAIVKEADVIHITRTWQFLHNSTLIGN